MQVLSLLVIRRRVGEGIIPVWAGMASADYHLCGVMRRRKMSEKLGQD